MEYKEAKAIMMERFGMSDLFSQEELEFINSSIIEDKKTGAAILKLGALNQIQEKGMIKNFYTVCKKYNYFPDWLNNVANRVDCID